MNTVIELHHWCYWYFGFDNECIVNENHSYSTTFFIPYSIIYCIYVLHYNISHNSLTDKEDANILMNCQQYFVPFPYQKRKNVSEEISTRGAQQILTKEYQRLDIVFPPYIF